MTGITNSPWFFNGGELSGSGVLRTRRTLKDLEGIFADGTAFDAMPKDTVVYEVASLEPDAAGTPGGLYMGITFLHPGKVGQEYFMTKGHFHLNSTSTEYYWVVRGEGMLILMDEGRRTWAETMKPGTLHYIRAGIAHRVANTGRETLVFAASWPSDAGHDYERIKREGFAARLLEINGRPSLV